MEQQLAQAIEAGQGEVAAAAVMAALAEGRAPAQVAQELVLAAIPALDLCASLPFPVRSLDLLFCASQLAAKATPRAAGLALASAASQVAASPRKMRQLPRAAAPSLKGVDAGEALSQALRRSELPAALAALGEVLARGEWHPALGKALLAGACVDVFQGGERALAALAAWKLCAPLTPAQARPLLERVLLYLCAEPRDHAAGRALEEIQAGRPVPALEPSRVELDWILGLIRGAASSALPGLIERLARPELAARVVEGVTLPPVAPRLHLEHAQRLRARSLKSIEGAQRRLYEALRQGDRPAALPLVKEVVGDGRGYGRVLRAVCLIGTERMIVRRYRFGFGMAQDLRLGHGAALAAEGLGMGAAIPAAFLAAFVAGRGGAALDLPPGEVPALTPPSRERPVLLERLGEAITHGQTQPAWEALAGLMAGPTPVSRITRPLLDRALLEGGEAGLGLSYVQACSALAEHLPRPDAEGVLAAAVAWITRDATPAPRSTWLTELADRHLPQPPGS